MTAIATLKSRQPGDPLPTRLQLFKLGENPSNQGPFFVDAQTLARLASVQRDIGRERVPIGFEHNIDEGSPEYARTSEPRQIAGTGTVEAVPGVGIFLTDIAWTKLGAESIDHFEDLSPTTLYDKASRQIVAILNVSLTRTGSIFGLSVENAATANLSAVLNLARQRLAAGAGTEPPLHGFARVVDANERQNAKHNQAPASLSAREHQSPIDPELRGHDRLVAAFERENAARKAIESA
jgi:hypothetical protein